MENFLNSAFNRKDKDIKSIVSLLTCMLNGMMCQSLMGVISRRNWREKSHSIKYQLPEDVFS